ncbi:hypothetical protein K8R78_01395, partial [bacterium]|nr:hypothetical protein [bacterium]
AEVARLSVMEMGLVKDVENLAPVDEDSPTLLPNFFEDELLSVLARRGYVAGTVSGSSGDSSSGGDSSGGSFAPVGNGGATREREEPDYSGMSEEEIEKYKAEYDEEMEGYEPEPTPPPTSSGEVTPGTLSYRVVDCRVIYSRVGGSIRRNAVPVVNVRVPSSDGSGYSWVGTVEGQYEDVVSSAAAEDLIDTRYADIGPVAPVTDEMPILEPIIVTAVTVGLIVLFSFTSQSGS